MAKLVLESTKVISSQALGHSLSIVLEVAFDVILEMEWGIVMTAVKKSITWHGMHNGNHLIDVAATSIGMFEWISTKVNIDSRSRGLQM